MGLVTKPEVASGEPRLAAENRRDSSRVAVRRVGDSPSQQRGGLHLVRSAAGNPRRLRDGFEDVGRNAFPAPRRLADVILAPRTTLALVDPEDRARGLVAAVSQMSRRHRPVSRGHDRHRHARRIDRLTTKRLGTDVVDDLASDLGGSVIARNGARRRRRRCWLGCSSCGARSHRRVGAGGGLPLVACTQQRHRADQRSAHRALVPCLRSRAASRWTRAGRDVALARAAARAPERLPIAAAERAAIARATARCRCAMPGRIRAAAGSFADPRRALGRELTGRGVARIERRRRRADGLHDGRIAPWWQVAIEVRLARFADARARRDPENEHDRSHDRYPFGMRPFEPFASWR